MKNTIQQSLSAGLLCVTILMAACGCGREVTQSADGSNAPAPAASQAGGSDAKDPRTATLQVGYQDAQAAMKSGDYEKAVQVMLQLQNQPGQPLTQEQAAAAARQMVAFQSQLGAAVASGDPKAIAAAQQLKAAGRH